MAVIWCQTTKEEVKAQVPLLSKLEWYWNPFEPRLLCKNALDFRDEEFDNVRWHKSQLLDQTILLQKAIKNNVVKEPLLRKKISWIWLVMVLYLWLICKPLRKNASFCGHNSLHMVLHGSLSFHEFFFTMFPFCLFKLSIRSMAEFYLRLSMSQVNHDKSINLSIK